MEEEDEGPSAEVLLKEDAAAKRDPEGYEGLEGAVEGEGDGADADPAGIERLD